MKKSRLAASAFALALLIPLATSCKSDENPFDIIVSQETQNAIIQIRLAVEETRAEDDSQPASPATPVTENDIKNVTVLVFNAQGKLELNKTVVVESGSSSVNLEVSNGLKTIYVVTAQSNVNPSVGMTLNDYENRTFQSTLENLKTSNGFVMVGKSNEQQVMISSSKEDVPSSNIFNITVKRLVAKAQVKKGDDFTSPSIGIDFDGISFKACQLNERMRVVHNGSDVIDSYADNNNNGTYDNYSLRPDDSYLDAPSSGFTADGCAYMSENIVATPVTGNTTFLSVRFSTKPQKYYTFNSTDNSLGLLDETPTTATYYAVATIDRASGVADYAIDGTNKHIITFKTQEAASDYMNSLNNGASSAMTVSQSDRPMMAPSFSGATRASSPFEVVAFTNGYVYYRVNIAHLESSGDSSTNVIKVVRNNFYKVSINSINSLGMATEALLRPTTPTTVLDAQGHSWIYANITIDTWEEVTQNVDL